MAYETIYELSWEGKSPTMEEIGEFIATQVEGSTPGQPGHEDAAQRWRGVLEGGEYPGGWTSYQRDIAAASRKWPGVLFELNMKGDLGKRDREYHRGGLVQYVEGKVIFPPFRPEELREPM